MLFGNKFEKIARLAEKGEEEKLVSFVNDKHEDVHLAAIDALGRCSGDVAFNALVPLVHSADKQTRIHAAGALCAMNDPKARAHLEHQRNAEKDPDVLKAIEEALAKIKDRI